MVRKGKILLAFVFIANITQLFGQDRIYLRKGELINCKISDTLDDKIYYKLTGEGKAIEINKSEVDLVKYGSGKIVEYPMTEEKKEPQAAKSAKPEKKFDRNDEEFVNYANSIARQMGQQILMKMAGQVENSSVSVYFDSVYKEMDTGDINIPIIIRYEKYNVLENGFIKGTIKVKTDGTKQWVFENAGKD